MYASIMHTQEKALRRCVLKRDGERRLDGPSVYCQPIRQICLPGVFLGDGGPLEMRHTLGGFAVRNVTLKIV